MKKKLCLALLSALMLTACSTGGQASGGSQIEASSGEQSTEVSSTPSSSSVDSTPVVKDLTIEEVQAQANKMATYINSDKYVEPQSYQFGTDQKMTEYGKGKDPDKTAYLKMVFKLDRPSEKVNLKVYNVWPAQNHSVERWLFKKEAGSYYHLEQTVVPSKQYQVIAATDFETLLGKANIPAGLGTYKDMVGNGIVKASSHTWLDAIGKYDFSKVTGLKTRLSGDGEGKLKMVFEKVTPVADSTDKNLVKYAFKFDKYNLTEVFVTQKVLAADDTVIKEANQRQVYDYTPVTVEVPTVDSSWTEIAE